MLLDAHDSHLLLLDYQLRLLPSIHEGPLVLANAQRLAHLARLFAVPVLLTEENPAGLGATVPELEALVRQAGGKTFAKMSFSAVAAGLVECLRPSTPAKTAPQGNSRSLPKHLQKPAPAQTPRNSVVMAGCEAHICLMQTALELLDDEFEVWVVTDACGSRTERNRDAAFDRLAAAGAELLSTEMVAFEWLRTADHPALAEVLALVK
ncbi:MAG: isochorismatase family protein [Hylemonella sp.]|jgi:nicotinamidase-related amidase